MISGLLSSCFARREHAANKGSGSRLHATASHRWRSRFLGGSIFRCRVGSEPARRVGVFCRRGARGQGPGGAVLLPLVSARETTDGRRKGGRRQRRHGSAEAWSWECFRHQEESLKRFFVCFYFSQRFPRGEEELDGGAAASSPSGLIWRFRQTRARVISCPTSPRHSKGKRSSRCRR